MDVFPLENDDLQMAYQAVVFLMPTYEYRCPKCNKTYEETRLVKNRNRPVYCYCGEYNKKYCLLGRVICERVLTVPTMQVWNQDRKFPNVTQYGDGTLSFKSKDDYNVHCKENHLGESAHDAPRIKRLGHKTVTVY